MVGHFKNFAASYLKFVWPFLDLMQVLIILCYF